MKKNLIKSSKTLTLEVVKHIAAAAETEANKNGWLVVIAVVDDGGHLLYLQRLDNTQFGSVEVATQKARCAVGFKRPTKTFADAVSSGRVGLLGLPGILPLEGGVPLTIDGDIVGAIGVSGVTSEQDGQIAKAGADALNGLLSG